MIDFLRANTWCSQEEYKWGMTVPQVRLASMDFTHIEYLDDDKKHTNEEARNLSNATIIRGADDLKNVNDLGIPIV